MPKLEDEDKKMLKDLGVDDPQKSIEKKINDKYKQAVEDAIVGKALDNRNWYDKTFGGNPRYVEQDEKDEDEIIKQKINRASKY